MVELHKYATKENSLMEIEAHLNALIENVTSVVSAIESYTTTWGEITGSMSAQIDLMTAINGKNPMITAGAHIIDADTNAVTNAPTNLNTITTLLGVLVGEVNSINSRYNTLAGKYNALATKFNTVLDRLESSGIILP